MAQFSIFKKQGDEMKKQELMNEIEIAVDEFIHSNKTESFSLIRKRHEKKCMGVKQTGNTAVFCGCFTSKSVQAIVDMHQSWHQDMKLRVNRIKDIDGMISKEDVLFLLNENQKWG